MLIRVKIPTEPEQWLKFALMFYCTWCRHDSLLHPFSFRKTLGAFLRCVLYGISNLIPKTGMRLGVLPWRFPSGRGALLQSAGHYTVTNRGCSKLYPRLLSGDPVRAKLFTIWLFYQEENFDSSTLNSQLSIFINFFPKKRPMSPSRNC